MNLENTNCTANTLEKPSLTNRFRFWCERGDNWALPLLVELLGVPFVYREMLPLTWFSVAAVFACYVVRWSWRGSWPWKPPKRGWW